MCQYLLGGASDGAAVNIAECNGLRGKLKDTGDSSPFIIFVLEVSKKSKRTGKHC